MNLVRCSPTSDEVKFQNSSNFIRLPSKHIEYLADPGGWAAKGVAL